PDCGLNAPLDERAPEASLDRSGAELKLRSDLVIEPVEEEGTVFYIIKDPVDNRFFRVKALEHFLISQFDGKTSLEEIRRHASDQHRVLVAPEVLARFAEKFKALGLLVDPDQGESREPSRQRTGRRGGILFLKLGLVDPERLLDWLYPKLTWALRPGFVGVMAATILFAAVVAVANHESLLFGLRAIATMEGLFLIYLTVSLVTVLHELAHGITCRHFGGRVQDMGFLLMYFVPCFYCNVSDAYLFKEKRQRLWVTSAGGLLELFIWALGVLAWRVLAPDTIPSRVAFIVAGVCGVKSLLNFNPLIKLDGYYLLTDYLGVANLRKEALSGLGRFLRRRVFGLPTDRPRADLVSRRILSLRGDRFVTLFGAAALGFTGLLLGYIVLWSGEWVFHEFGSSGLGLFSLAMVGLLHKPAARAASSARSVRKDKWQQLGRQKRRLRVITFWVVLLLGFALFPWQLRIASELQVLPQNRVTVRAKAEGRIARIHFLEGQRVQKGDLLLEYDVGELELERKTKEAELAAAREELRLLVKQNPTSQEEIRVQERALETARAREQAAAQEFDRVKQLWTSGLVSRERFDIARNELDQAESRRRQEEARMQLVLKASPDSRNEQMEVFHLRDPEAQHAIIRKLEAEVARLEDLLERSRIHAPISGTLTTYRFQEKVGEYLEEGDFVCEIADDDRVVIEMPVAEKEIDAIQMGFPVKFKVRGYPYRSFHAQVAEIAPVATPGDKTSSVLIRAVVDNPDHILKPGMTGVAKVYCGRTFVAHVLTRDLIRFIRTEFWL
ncbi:MAG: efflux RND transporter periplasmic adaptor subunit, partial [Acidobacteriota bacterium]